MLDINSIMEMNISKRDSHILEILEILNRVFRKSHWQAAT